MAGLRNMPGKCCCCPCVLDKWVTSFIADAGTWTRNTSPRNAVTTSSDARLRSSQTRTGWHALRVTIDHTIAGEWVQIGFTKDNSYNDKIYIRVRAVSATRALEIEYRETILDPVTLIATDTLIATQSFTTGFTVSDLSSSWWLILDPDYNTITGLVSWKGIWRNLRASTTATGTQYAYVGTETSTGTTTASYATTRHCYSPIGCPGSGNCFTDRAPHEWEIDLSGVALGEEVEVCRKRPIMGGGLGTPYFGYFDWWNELNAVHVPNSEGGILGARYWRLMDVYQWTEPNVQCNGPLEANDYVDVEWRVQAFWAERWSGLIHTCSSYNPGNASLNPEYIGKPVLVLTVSLGISHVRTFGSITEVLVASWAAIVQEDWDSVFPDTYYYYGDEHVMTPSLFPATCNFDWRTIQQKKLTFVCSTSPGINFDNSSLYISAKP